MALTDSQLAAYNSLVNSMGIEYANQFAATMEAVNKGTPVAEATQQAFSSPASSVSTSSSATVSSPSLSELYQQYLGRSPDAEGLQYWSSNFGSTIDPNEVAIFKQATDDARTAGIEPPAPTQTTTATQSSTSSASSQRQQALDDWVYSHEPLLYQKTYQAIQSGNAKIEQLNGGRLVVKDASNNIIEGVGVDPNTGQIRVPTSNGALWVSTEIGQGGKLTPISYENYNKQVRYQSKGNDWDKYGGLVLGAAGLLGAPYLSSLIGGATGLTGASLSAATGATIGGLGSAVMGGDPLKGALLGGLGGYAMGSLSNAATPTDLGMNSQLTPAAIESGLGTPGYGYNAAAASSGLFNPAAVGAGAYLQTSYPYDMADFLAADALQLQGQVGNNLPAIEQNLIATGVDPLVAADVANQVALNPGISQYDLTNYINTNFGGGNIYDVNTATQYPTSQLPGEGGLLTDMASGNFVGPQTAEQLGQGFEDYMRQGGYEPIPQADYSNEGRNYPTAESTQGLGGSPINASMAATAAGAGLTASQIANLVKAGLSLAGAGAITSNMGGGMGGIGALPTQGVPTNTPEYYQAIQQYYNAYMPDVPRDVATPLQQWYDSKYGA